MLAKVDIISINCPYTPATYHLLSPRRLRLLQPHALLVNTARGEILDEEDWCDCSKPALSGAPVSMSSSMNRPFTRSCRAIAAHELGDHRGADCDGRKSVINIQTFADGDCPPDWVNGSML